MSRPDVRWRVRTERRKRITGPYVVHTVLSDGDDAYTFPHDEGAPCQLCALEDALAALRALIPLIEPWRDYGFNHDDYRDKVRPAIDASIEALSRLPENRP